MTKENDKNNSNVQEKHQSRSEGLGKTKWLAAAKDRLKIGTKSQQKKSVWKHTWMPTGEPTVENLRAEFQRTGSDFELDNKSGRPVFK